MMDISMVEGTITKRVYVYDPAQPPTAGRSTNATLTVTNSNHLSISKLDGTTPIFKLSITKARSLGLSSFENSDINKFIQMIILACNLIMKKAAFSTTLPDSSHAEISIEKPTPIPTKTEKTSTGDKVSLADHVGPIRDSMSTIVGFTDVLDETQALDTLQNIQTVYNSNTMESHNLQKALKAYLDGTTTGNTVTAFQHIYESLELAGNSDGYNDTGKRFDKKICGILENNHLPIGILREFNNRIKHIDDHRQRIDYKDAMKRTTKKISELRSIATSVMLHKLTSVDITVRETQSYKQPRNK